MTVYLVGAGPGDPELITARGLKLIQNCHVLIHDRLVAAELVAEAPTSALVISRHHLDQEQINHLLLTHGQRGHNVVRLKGGDPFLFGRGGEEALALTHAGVPFEIVPGVSTLASVPAAAGIPITHRGLSSQVTIANGHGPLNYAALAHTPGTLVLYMALGRLQEITNGLLAAGKPPNTPAAVIAHGTLPDQRSARAPLERIANAAATLQPPALTVIGDVVTIAEHLAPATTTIAA